MKVLFDTNVILDVLLDRQPFSGPAVFLLGQVEKGELSGYLGATTVTTIHYLVCKGMGRERAEEAVRKLLQIFEVAPATRAVLESALHTGMEDFEDAVLHQSAYLSGCEAIVTRNGRDFTRSRLTIFTPEELMATGVMKAEGREI